MVNDVVSADVDVAGAVEWFGDHLTLFVLMLTRLGTMLMAMPAIGVGVPRRVRAMLAILMTFLLLGPVAAGPVAAGPLASGGAPVQIGDSPSMAVALAREGLIGILVGGCVQVLVSGFQTGGEIMTGTGGMQLGDAIDPSMGGPVPAIARMVGMAVVATMLCVGGHRVVFDLLVTTFDAMPPGDVSLTRPMLDVVVDEVAGSLAVGVRLAAPVVAALLLANLITGLISRTLPQINVLAIGLGINALTLMMVLALSIGGVAYLFRQRLDAAVENVAALF